MVTLYFALGIVLVIAFAVVILYYYSPRNKDSVEAAKYEMLKDDDLPPEQRQRPEDRS